MSAVRLSSLPARVARGVSWCLVAALAVTTACFESPFAPGRGVMVSLDLRSADATTQLTGERLDVVVTGPGIETPVTASVRFVNDTARVELEVPRGDDRVIQLAIFDSSDVLIASGQTTTNIGTGAAVTVPVVVAPTTGTLPVVVTGGAVTLSIAPGTVTLGPGGTQALTATVTDATGAPIQGATVRYASSNPAVASVNPTTGVITAVIPGTTFVTANVLGVAARIPVAVSLPDNE
jgi:hypothetical protein